MDDAALLHRYVTDRSDQAFAELVRRHLNLVYFAALRQIPHAPHLAEDAAQTVFTLLARKAPTLTRHPALAGWLHTTAVFTARDLVRSEHHRRDRELTALHMHELLADPTNNADWEKLRPVIDDALCALPTTDREAILLRFFENRPFSEIGSALRLSEDTARMRVNRALEKLRAVLVKRGVTSTSAALTTALAGQSALAAPAGLATQISTDVFTSLTTVAATTSAGTTALLALKLMAASKITTALATTAAVIGLGTAYFANHRANETSRELARSRHQHAEATARIDELEAHLRVTKKDAREIEDDNARLLASVEAAQITLVNNPAAPATAESLEARFNNAKQLVRQGQHAEALREFLACYDQGKSLRGSSFWAIRNFSLMAEVVKLGKVYPPALAVVRERREATEQLLKTASGKPVPDDVQEYANLNRELRETHRTLALHDSRPAGDPLRTALTYSVHDELLAAQRYTEILGERPPHQMLGQFHLIANFLNKRSSPDVQKRRAELVADAVKNIEVIAGAGQPDDAREFITQVLKVDSSAETKALLSKHLTRAGHPELLAP